MRTIFDDPYPEAPPSMAEVASRSRTLRSWLSMGFLAEDGGCPIRIGWCECHDPGDHVVAVVGDLMVCVTGCWGDHEPDLA